jgi:transposase InsO family protein
MPWKTMDVREQRVSFVVTASRGEKSLTALCQEFGISRPTGYLWLSRYRREGLLGLPNAAGGRRGVRIELRRQWKKRWWGCSRDIQIGERARLQVLLQQRGLELARSTIHRILLRHGMIREPEHPGLAPQRFERSAPNELWQMDFKDPLCPAERVGPLSVLDDHRRYLLVLQRVANTSAELVREHLQGAFRECGVPDGMLMDHGTPWWSAQSPQGFAKLSLWLMKQGIALHWGRIRHPQTQGKVERFHGELQQALRCRPPRADLQEWLDEFRWEHNHVRPHEALGMQTPVSHWWRSERAYDPNPPALGVSGGVVGAQGGQ